MSEISFTPSASRDLDAIWGYTFDSWGVEQADRYLALIAECMDRIADGRAATRVWVEIDDDLRSHHCRHHVIFFLRAADGFAVIAIFHERMDLLQRLRDRIT